MSSLDGGGQLQEQAMLEQLMKHLDTSLMTHDKASKAQQMKNMNQLVSKMDKVNGLLPQLPMPAQGLLVIDGWR